MLKLLLNSYGGCMNSDKGYVSKTNYLTFKEVFREKPFVIILVIGFILRLSWCLYFPTYPETDFMWYHTKAVEISEGKGFLNGVYPTYAGDPSHPTAFRPIGYPGTLAAIYFFTGPNFLAGKMLNIFLSTITLILLYAISRKYFCKRISLWALAFFSFSPLAIVYTGILGSETLFQTLLLAVAYFTLARRNPYLIGICIGYLALVRPIGIYFLSVIVVFLFLDKNISIKRKFLQAGVAVVLALMVLSPWIIRNYLVFGSPVYSTNGGYVIYVNNNPQAEPNWTDPYKYPNSPFLKYVHGNWNDEVGMHEEGKTLAIKWIKENPKSFLYLACKRVYYAYWVKLDDVMWGFTTGVNQWNEGLKSKAIKIEKILFRPFNILVILAVIFTIFKYYRKHANEFDIFIVFLFLYFNAMMFVLEGNSRYLYPLHPFFAVLVAAFIMRCPLSYSSKEEKKPLKEA